MRQSLLHIAFKHFITKCGRLLPNAALLHNVVKMYYIITECTVIAERGATRPVRHGGTIRCLEHDFIVRKMAQGRQMRNVRTRAAASAVKCHIAGVDVNIASAANILLLRTRVRPDDADPSFLALTGPRRCHHPLPSSACAFA